MGFGDTLKNTVGKGLEREAQKQFGAAVDDFAGGILGGIFGKGPKPGNSADPGSSIPKDAGVWDPTHYASALVKEGTGDYRPKFKFLFKVTFHLNPDVIEALLPYVNQTDRELSEGLTFLVKSIDKPKYDFEYEEVNMYNFRTKVLKKITTTDLNMVMYDDVGNKAIDFFNIYRMAHQPLARLAQIANGTVDQHQLENNGFDFSTPLDGGGVEPNSLDSGLRGILPGNALHIINRMVVHQYYVDHSKGSDTSPTDWTKVNDFVFLHPRLTNIDFEDLDHENGSNFNIVTTRFDYDALYIDTGNAASADNLSPEFPGGDIMFSAGEDAVRGAQKARGAQIAAVGKKNPFLEIIARQGQRAVQETVSKALGTSFLGTIAGGQLAGAINTVGGSLGNAVNRTVRGLTGSSNQAEAGTSPVRDSGPSSSPATQTSSANPYVVSGSYKDDQ